METLKALPGAIQMISGKNEFFSSEAERFVEELRNYSTASSHYTVISIIGPQNTGKSCLLNKTFGTNFTELDATKEWKQTTEGIWIARCIDPCMIIMDVEGSDGIERGADTLFERRSALFSLTVSDILLLNLRFHDTSRVQGASWDLIKLILTERVKIDDPTKTTIIILLRDYEYQVPLDATNNKLQTKMIELWNEVHPATTDSKNMRDYIEVIVKDFPHKNYQPQQFAQKSKDLAKFLCSFAASGNLEQNHCASSFAYSSQRIWDLICNNKRLSVADHKLAMSAYVCNGIKNDILHSLEHYTEYRSLMYVTEKSAKEFNTELLIFLKRILTRYEKETRTYDKNITEQVRDKLEEETLQGFKETFKGKIVRLYYEKLSVAKSKVYGQLRKLAVRDRFSVIEVTRPFLTEFNDNLPSDVHPYFKKVLNKRRKEFGEEVSKIAEEEANQITEEEKNKIAEEKEKKIQRTMSHFVLYKNMEEILGSLDKETGYDSLMSSTTMTIKEFNEELPLFLERVLARYDKETRDFDENIMEKFRDKLEEQTLQRFKSRFEGKLFSLSNEILSIAKSEVRGKLRKLPLLDQHSVIGVLRPYLTKFDDNSHPDVHPYFQVVLIKHRNQLVEGLTRIAEKKGNKILSKDLAKFLRSFAASGNLEQNHCASSFAYSSERIWDLICNNKRLSVADHKLAMSAYVCNEIKNDILCSLEHQTSPYVEAPCIDGAPCAFVFPMPTAPPNDRAYLAPGPQSPYVEAPCIDGAPCAFVFPMPTAPPNDRAYLAPGPQSPYVEAPCIDGAPCAFVFPMPTAPPGTQRNP